MKTLKTSILSLQQKKTIYVLWNNEYPINLTYSSFEEFENYLQNLNNQNHLLLIDENETVKAWYFDFIRENEKWYVMILDSEIQKKGVGTYLLNEAKKSTTELNGWVIEHNNYKKTNGNIYKSPIQFYLKNNFKLVPEIRLALPNISAIKIKWVK